MELRYVFVKLHIQDGERAYVINEAFPTRAENLAFAAERYASKYWGDSYRGELGWESWNGEVVTYLHGWKELSAIEYSRFREITTL